MSLDTEIEGSPASIEGAATWLDDTLVTGLESTSTALVRARRHVGDGWEGSAAESFSGWSGDSVATIDEVGSGVTSASATLRAFATSLRSAQGRMADIRAAASAAGLSVSGFVIANPGAGPGDPRAGGGEADAAAVAAFDTHQAKIRAWNKAVEDVDAVHDDIRAASTALQDDYRGLEDHAWFLNGSDVLGGVGGAVAQFQASVLRGTSDELLRTAREYLETVGKADPAVVGHGKYYDDLRNAADDIRRLEDLGQRADDLDGKGGRMPIKLGGVLAGAGIIVDIAGGKDPVQATVSGGGGFVASVAAGAAVGTFIGGPVGTGVGAVVGAGVGIFTSGAIDSLFENGPDVGQAVEDGWDAVTDTGGAIADGVGGAIEGIGGLFG